MPGTQQMRFSGANGKNCGVFLYEDVAESSAQDTMTCRLATNPREAGLADHQMISVWCESTEAMSLEKVEPLLFQIITLFEDAGWAITEKEPVLSRLVRVSTLPSKRNLQGYNALHGFSFEFEKKGTKPSFSTEELLALTRLALDVQRLLYGQQS